MTDAAKQYEDLADALDEVREELGAMVAGLVSEGFTDEQARWLVVGAMTLHLNKSKTEGGAS